MDWIIYLGDLGNVSVIIPVEGWDASVVARKDVPAGRPYKIVPSSSLPTLLDPLFDAWEADFSDPDGYGIGPEAWFAEQEALNAQEEPIEEVTE